jgi:type I site-specific restriction endonuclease
MDTDKAPRYYQVNAVNAATEAIAKGHDRILLVMATRTGKTYTAFQILWRLWKAGRKKRILYLADRRHLASVLRQGRKTRILTPVWESSGEHRLNFGSFPMAGLGADAIFVLP